MNLDKDGILIIKNVFNNCNYLDNINSKLYEFLEKKNNKYNRNDNCLHHIPVYDKHILDEILITIYNLDEVKKYFKSNFILHTCGGVINKPSKKSYTHNWHIDSNEKNNNNNTILNVLVPLCNFTLENGCTKIFPKKSDVYKNILLNKGDVLFFDSSLTHCTGNNTSNHHRNCLTITLVKIYIKPQFSYSLLFNKEEMEELDDDLKMLYDFKSQIPNNLKDFYGKKFITK
jgi:ectoine hydroxylase-related dioxygenase (phytanoyl-CoA dioxygenase family)